MHKCNLHWILLIVHVLLLLSSPDSGMGMIYVSDYRGIVFSKSLERHLYTSTGGETDFTVISSLRGVYITSVLAHGTHTLTCSLSQTLTRTHKKFCVIINSSDSRIATINALSAHTMHLFYIRCVGISVDCSLKRYNRCVCVWAHVTWSVLLCTDGSVQTVITFNQGGNWMTLKKPWNAACDSTAKDPDMVRVHHTHLYIDIHALQDLLEEYIQEVVSCQTKVNEG